MKASIFETVIIEVGDEAESFRSEGMYVLYGPEAPEHLRNHCYILQNNPAPDLLAVGQTLVVDGIRFPVTAVGSAVEVNLGTRGHITLVFNGAQHADMQGSLYVDVAGQELPYLKVGSHLAVEH